MVTSLAGSWSKQNKERKGDMRKENQVGARSERNLLSTIRTFCYILRVMGRLKTSRGLEIRKGFLEEVSLE